MFSLKKIVLPVDFSDRSKGAARYAEVFARHFGSEVHMLHVVPPLHYEYAALDDPGATFAELYDSRKQTLGQQLQSFLLAEMRELNTRRALLEGDPAGKIVEYAHERQADLIVMPTHGYGPFRRFILGSVTAKVLHDADCAVWTGIHLDAAPPVDRIAFQHILAAVDLGPQSEKTLHWAAQFAASRTARLTLAHVTPNIEGQSGEYFDPDWKLHLRRQAEERMAALQSSVGTQADCYVESGDVPQTICGAAASLGADALVIGRGSASGVFGRLRANAYAIIRQSACPVASV